jgi:hypothetical protein
VIEFDRYDAAPLSARVCARVRAQLNSGDDGAGSSGASSCGCAAAAATTTAPPAAADETARLSQRPSAVQINDGAEQEQEDAEEEDVSQLDSPRSRAQLLAGISDAVREARDSMALRLAQRDGALSQLPVAPAWAKAKLRAHEAYWMRTEIVRLMQGVGLTSMPKGDYMLGRFTIVLRRPLVRRRACGLLEMPELYNYLVDKRKIHVINFATEDAMSMLQDAGLGCVPCDSPSCDGLGGGKWDTVPLQWSCETSAPQITLDELGMPSPTICMRSRCKTCGLPFHHTGAVTLARMRDVSEPSSNAPVTPITLPSLPSHSRHSHHTPRLPSLPSRPSRPHNHPHTPTHRPYPRPVDGGYVATATRGGDSHCQTDGGDGDGQGGRFWAEQHQPKGEAPFKRAAGEKKSGPKAVLLDFE